MILAIVTSGFPRLSETFLLNELLALDSAGILAGIFATKPGDHALVQPGCERLARRVHTLAPGPVNEQAREVVECLRGTPVDGVHGYFAHDPAAVAHTAAGILGVPFSFSVHARDARKIAPDVLAAQAREATVVVACNPDVAGDVRRVGGEVQLMAHGVDLARFTPAPLPEAPFSMLAVGRLVEKKGFSVLLDAVALLDVPFRLRVVGDGKLRPRLEEQLARLGLEDRVKLVGPGTHASLPAEYARAHAVVVPSVVDRSGDRDGLPNVVLEALACGRPVVGTDVGAIASAIEDGVNGYIVAAGDAEGLAGRLRRLATDPIEIARMGRAARRVATRDFDLIGCSDRLVKLLRCVYG